MDPTILEGDTVLVRDQPDAQNNQVVLAVVEDEDTPAGGEGVVKRLHRQFGVAELRSDNEEWGVIRSGFRIEGIVVALIRQIK